ncbi:hypothetical protein [Halobacteriovorax sp. JY17]|uniref:hypothetical protein n=1 Tax=Halobacteriovorax sp. JY17 TaxID=2014617 RepID=UPI000C3A7325|nr:hypothetical protein [Halobacteriovorax sp. JY17]PIK14022.1 MAG: hypothetical protein CES88_13645 [Halobacteriovorax sp. JY17]
MDTLNLKRIFHLLDSSCLRGLFYFPYFIAEKIACYSFSQIGANVWVRNSYFLRTLVVGISDLDISIQLLEPPTTLQIKKIKAKYRLLKTFFPFLGEINIYLKRDEAIFNVFNRLEMNRDPYLREIGSDQQIISEYQKLVFILRMFEADRENLYKYPHYRQKKWVSHFHAIGLESIDYVTADDIVNYLSESISKDKRYSLALNKFLESGRYHFSISRESIILFPHRWAVWVNVNGGLEEEYQKLALTTEERKIIQEMIKWEVMGLYTQIYLIEESQNIEFYLDLLKRMNLLISSDESSQIDLVIDRLIRA